MDTIEEMLKEWKQSASVMHVGHHRAASRYGMYHRWFGGAVAGLSALVASSIFVAAIQDENSAAYLVAVVVSLLTVVLTGINTSLNLSGRSQAHFAAATKFQGLRRALEEEFVRFRGGVEKDSYEHIRSRWSEALEVAPPLPQDIFDKESERFEVY